MPQQDQKTFSESLQTAWKVKNTMTSYIFLLTWIGSIISFVVFFKHGIIISLCAFGNVKPIYGYAIVYYLLAHYGGNYGITKKFSWREEIQFRVQIIYPICLLIVAITWIQVKGSSVGLLDAVVVELVARQIFFALSLPIDVYYINMDIPDDLLFHDTQHKLSIVKILKFYLFVGAFVNLIISLFFNLLIFAMLIPIFLSYLNLNEDEHILIYGVAFPFVKYCMGYLAGILVSALRKGAVFNDNPSGVTFIQFAISLAIGLCFSVTPLLCMLYLSQTPLTFCLSYIPHAFFSKILWILRIPEVQAKLDRQMLTLKVSCCFMGKQSVGPIEEGNPIASDVITTIEEGSKNEMEEIITENKVISNFAAVQEVCDLLVHNIAIVACLFRLLNLCFVLHNPEGLTNEFSFSAIQSQFLTLLINVFCIILPLDQVISVCGFAIFEYKNIPVDPNFNLDVNILNPIRTWQNGSRFSAIGSLSFCICLWLIVSCGIAIGTNGVLLV